MTQPAEQDELEEQPSHLALMKPPGIVEPAVSVEKIVEHMRTFSRLKQELLDDNDVTTINTREGQKKVIRKSGWRKLALAFNINDRIIEKEKDDVDNGEYIWRITAEAWHANGRSAVGIGACSSIEIKKKQGNRENIDHVVYSMAHTRAKSRAISDLIGSGEPSAEEMEEENEKHESTDRPVSEAELKAREDAKKFANKYLCPDCNKRFSTELQMEEHRRERYRVHE